MALFGKIFHKSWRNVHRSTPRMLNWQHTKARTWNGYELTWHYKLPKTITKRWQTVWRRKMKIFNGVMVRIGKVEPWRWPFRSGTKVPITGFSQGSTFPILTNGPVIDYFSCPSTLIDLWRRNSTFSTRLLRMTLCCHAALLCNVAKPEVVHARRWKIPSIYNDFVR